MEILTRIGWVLLALIHLLPSAVLFNPRLTEKLYGLTASSDVGLLIVHRGALFLAIVVSALWAAVDPAVRGLASVILTISMLGFLIIYWRAGMPVGALRMIAIVDIIGVGILFFLIVDLVSYSRG